jgi:hypothetical protein
MQKSTRRIKTVVCLALSTFLSLCLGCLVRAQTNLPTFGPLACPGQSTAYPKNSMICTMTIQIFYDDANHFIFPVLEMGQGRIDKWMQAWFSIHNDQLNANPFPRNNTYRIYINPKNGIAPNTGVSLTLPLFTALKTIPNPMTQAFSNPGTGLGMPDTFIDWWSGGNIQLYTSPGTTSAPQPTSLTNELKRPLAEQKPLSVPWDPSAPPAPTAGGPPTCTPVKSKAPNAPDPAAKCEDLIIYVDTGGIGKQGGSQLLEYTLGAVNANQSPQNATSWINYWLDTHNVDVDISYVDVAWMPGVMGVFGNDQVGFTGTPQSVDDFVFGPCPMPGDQSCAQNQRKGGLTDFKNDANTKGWPQYRDTFANLNHPPPPLPADPCSGADRVVACVTYLKFPSPIDVFSTLADSVSGGAPPPDFFPVPNSADWKAGPPTALNAWPPIQTLYNKWIAAVGKVDKPGTTSCGTQTYRPGTPINDWCTAMRAQKTILLANGASQ